MTRALKIFDTVPAGHIVHAVPDRHCQPLLQPGEVAVITDQPELYVDDGAWYLVEHQSIPSYPGERLRTKREIVQAKLHPKLGLWFFAVPAQVPGGPIATADGPYDDARACQKVMGQVVGIYRPGGTGWQQIGEAA